MATFKRFEDMEVWHKARAVVLAVYDCTKKGAFARDFALRYQVRRAAISVVSNIAEGFEREGRAELVQFLSVAKGSLGEVMAQLYVALDQGYVTQEEFNQLSGQVQDTRKLLAGLMNYLKRSDIAGQKYKGR